MNLSRIIPFLCLSMATIIPVGAASSGEISQTPSVVVTGQGKVKTRPDTANINLGVASVSPTAAEALSKNTSDMNTLMKTLTSNGIEERDIQTAQFSVNPEYHQPNARNTGEPYSPPKITGYRVSNEVRIKVRNLKNLGKVLDQVVTAGANQVHGISFSVAEPEPLLDEARKNATLDAKRKAEIYANAAGIKLGKVLFITESAPHFPGPIPMMTMSRQYAEASSVPISPGEQEISTTVSVGYAIE